MPVNRKKNRPPLGAGTTGASGKARIISTTGTEPKEVLSNRGVM